jgi:hypothetical protein
MRTSSVWLLKKYLKTPITAEYMIAESSIAKQRSSTLWASVVLIIILADVLTRMML